MASCEKRIGETMTKHLHDELHKEFDEYVCCGADFCPGYHSEDIEKIITWIDKHFLSKEDVKEAIDNLTDHGGDVPSGELRKKLGIT